MSLRYSACCSRKRAGVPAAALTASESLRYVCMKRLAVRFHRLCEKLAVKPVSPLFGAVIRKADVEIDQKRRRCPDIRESAAPRSFWVPIRMSAPSSG